MLHLVTGRSGSGKTTYVNRILHGLAEDGNNKLLLIVPEQFSFASERSILSSLSTKDAQNIEVLSFTRLVDYVGRKVGGFCGTFADEGTKIILMMRAMEGIQDNLNFYSAHSDSVPLAGEFITLINELKKEKITPDMLEKASRSTNIHTFSLKLHELSLIYSAFESLLLQKYTDDENLQDKLCNKLANTAFFNDYTIAIDAFKGFTGQELEVIKYLILQANDVYLTLCTDDIYGKDPSMIFNSVNDTARKIIKIAKENNVPVVLTDRKKSGIASGLRFESEELKFLEQNVFSPTCDTYQKEADNIVLCEAANIYDECNYIAATVRKLIRKENMRLKDMAVIVRNEDTYKRELISAFNRFDIPVFEDVRQPIANQPLIVMCKAILNLMTGGFTTDNLLRYMKTGLTPLSYTEVSELENYALMWNLKAKAWSEDFTLNPDGMDVPCTEKTEEKLKLLNEMRQRTVLPLFALRRKLHDTTSFKISEAIYEFLLKTGVPERLKAFAHELNDDGYAALASEQNRIWEILMDVLDKLGVIYGDTPTSVSSYYNLFCAVITATDLGSIPHGLDEITIGSADRMRLSSPKAVFVAGCAEDVFPASIRTNGILSQNDRKNLRELGIELSASNELKACEERFIAYTAVCSPCQKLFISYHKVSESGENLLPSSIFESVRSMFQSHIKILDTTSLSPEYFSETEHSTFVSYANNYNVKSIDFTSIQNTLRTSLKGSEIYSSKLASMDAIRDRKPFKINDVRIATELFGKDMFLSASRVDVYHKCAFEYFCKYGIRANPRRKAQLDPAVSGTVIHYVLEQIIHEYGKERLIKMRKDERKNSVDKWLSVYLDDVIGGFDNKTVRFKYLYNRLAFSLYDIVNRLCEEFEISDFIPCDFELPIGNDDEGIPGYTLPLENGGKLQIRGSVDRVDKYEKDGKTYIRVVDYKSGGKDFVLSDVLAGLNMQMLIYLFAIEAGGQKKYGNSIIPSGILYYPAKRNSVSMPNKNPPEDEVKKEKMKADRGNGLFLLNNDVLEAMEHGIKGLFIPVTDSKGKLTKNLITLQNMGLLKNRIDRVLTDMAECLQKGIIPANPAYGKDYKKTCEYCDYASVCGFENGTGREIVKMRNEDVFTILNGGEENA